MTETGGVMRGTNAFSEELVYSHAFYRVTKLTNKRSSIIPREDRVDIIIDQHVSLAR
jgi:hypothetical protein